MGRLPEPATLRQALLESRASLVDVAQAELAHRHQGAQVHRCRAFTGQLGEERAQGRVVPGLEGDARAGDRGLRIRVRVHLRGLAILLVGKSMVVTQRSLARPSPQRVAARAGIGVLLQAPGQPIELREVAEPRPGEQGLAVHPARRRLPRPEPVLADAVELRERALGQPGVPQGNDPLTQRCAGGAVPCEPAMDERGTVPALVRPATVERLPVVDREAQLLAVRDRVSQDERGALRDEAARFDEGGDRRRQVGGGQIDDGGQRGPWAWLRVDHERRQALARCGRQGVAGGLPPPSHAA